MYRIACSFPVAVAVERARETQSANREYVKHLSLAEKNAFLRICKQELKLDIAPTFEEQDE